MRLVLATLLAVCACASFAQTTTSLTTLTSKNTAACSAAGAPAYCKTAFKGLTDTASGTYDAAPGTVSNLDIHTLLYQPNTTQIFAHFMPWFCMQPGSRSTGIGTLCQSHLQVGYNSDDAAAVSGQMDDMAQRGFDGVVVDWYGPSLNFYDKVTLKVRDKLEPQCSGPQACPLLFVLMEDQGAFEWGPGSCLMNGGGVDQTSCILAKLQTDMDYANANYFNKNSYLKIDTATMNPLPNGKPAVLFFLCEECWTNPAPNWTNIWNSLRTYTNRYSTGSPAMFFIHRNAPAFAHVQTNGGYAWVNWDNSKGTDSYGLNYLDQFYTAATSATANNPSLITFGGAWKGFDETNAPWISGTPRTIGQQCGNTWLQTIRKANQYYNAAKPSLPFFGVVTWNDYEEGTEIETGIDNCLSVATSISGSVLSWQPKFSASSGTEDTVSTYEIYAGTSNDNLTKLTSMGVGSRNLDLAQFTMLQAGQTYNVYVRAVGQPSILNKISNAVKFRRR